MIYIANQFNAVLYGAYGLSWGAHEIVLTNEGEVANFSFLDLDYVRFSDPADQTVYITNPALLLQIVWQNTVVSVVSTMNSTTIFPGDFDVSGNWESAGTNTSLGTQSGM